MRSGVTPVQKSNLDQIPTAFTKMKTLSMNVSHEQLPGRLPTSANSFSFQQLVCLHAVMPKRCFPKLHFFLPSDANRQSPPPTNKTWLSNPIQKLKQNAHNDVVACRVQPTNQTDSKLPNDCFNHIAFVPTDSFDCSSTNQHLDQNAATGTNPCRDHPLLVNFTWKFVSLFPWRWVVWAFFLF